MCVPSLSAASSVGRAPRWLLVDNLLTVSLLSELTPPHPTPPWMFRKYGFSGGWSGRLAALWSSWPAFSLLLRAAGILSSQEKLLARPFPSFLLTLVATKTGAQQSVRNDVMLAGRDMGGRASWPYLVPPVCPGPLTLTLHVTSEGTQTGSDCSHSTEAEVASKFTPAGRHE